MKKPQEKLPQIYSDKTGSPMRSYFIDIKASANGSYYLSLSESSRNSRGEYERHRLLIFNNDIDQFVGAVNKAYEKFRMLRNGKMKRLTDPVDPKDNNLG